MASLRLSQEMLLKSVENNEEDLEALNKCTDSVRTKLRGAC